MGPRSHHYLSVHRIGAGPTTRWLAETQKRLEEALRYFGRDRELVSIGVRDVEGYAGHLRTVENGRGGTLAPGTQRHYLNALSNLFRRAQGARVVPPGYNPVAALMEKPVTRRGEADWLEVPDAALFLEACRQHTPKRADLAQPHLHAIVATFLLTGGREKEVLGLAADDVSFDRGTLTFRPNPHRRLKTQSSHRTVPLFPQLRDVLQEHVFERGRASGLLFPSPRGGGMVRDLRRALDRAGERAGFEPGEVRTKAFRHTFCAAALQLLDRGAPIAPWTVAKWMGHGGRSLVDRVYGHLGEIRHRSEVVEFRVEQHADRLGDRLSALRAWKPRRCQGVTREGERCQFRSLHGASFCRLHEPAETEEWARL